MIIFELIKCYDVIVPIKGYFLRLLFVFLGIGTGLAQNLVKNPSFEYYENCPKRLGNFNTDVTSWSTPTEGSTDYFNACSITMGAPKNFNGNQTSDFGRGYSGLYFYAPDNYREYLQAELSQPLEKGKMYQVSFYVSLAERSDAAINEFGVLFAQNRLSVPTTKPLSKGVLFKKMDNAYNAMEIGHPTYFSDTQKWVLVNTQFMAKGTERFLIVGNFKENERTRLLELKRNAERGAYYYLDMVSVSLVGDYPSRQSSIEESDIVVNETRVFESVFFDFDRFGLQETAKKELLEIGDYLTRHPELFITINGHCDSTGSLNHNQMLSELRAKAVAEFLISLGVAGQRITWAGFGGRKPIATNTTQSGRERNRRVEFVITNR